MAAEVDPRSELAELERATAATRAAAPRAWVAVGLFSAITALAAPMYSLKSLDAGDVHSSVVFGGSTLLAHSGAIQAYWLIALPVAYLMIAGYMAGHAIRSGVRGSTLALVLTGFVAYVIAVIATVLAPEIVGTIVPATITGRGMLPLLVPPVALFVWASLSRLRAAGIASVVMLAASLMAILYNVDNPLRSAGFEVRSELGPVVNLLFCAVVYAMCAAVLVFVERN